MSLPFHYGAGNNTKKFAKQLRQKATSAEDLFWKMVRNRKMLNLKIRRQHAIGRYIADFYCHELLLVIELDGSIHDLEHIKKKDKIRDEIIGREGIHIMRFSNDDVFLNPHLIEKRIKEYMESRQ